MNNVFVIGKSKVIIPIDHSDLNICVKAIKELISKYHVIVININLRVVGALYQEQKGIELLVRLRLAEIMNHCILHSCETLYDVMAKNPKNIIITSKGTSYCRTTLDLNKIVDKAYYDNIWKNKAIKQNFILNLKKYYDITLIRHHLANIYGVAMLMQIFDKYIFDETDQFGNKRFKEYDPLMLGVYQYISNNAYEIEQEKKDFLLDNISLLTNKLSEINPHILYIDDMASIGWTELFKKTIYKNAANPNLYVEVPCKHDFELGINYKQYIQKINEYISKDRDDNKFVVCVLLDMRLTDEIGVFDEIEQISGIKLLKDIRAAFPELPVIMTSASNKSDSVSYAMNCGATAFWTKPGIDYVHNEYYYIEQYLKLLKSIDEAQEKYEASIDKSIARAGNTIAELSLKNDIDISKISMYDDVDAVIFDTCIWSATTEADIQAYYPSIYKIYRWTKKQNKIFAVIDDVSLELLKHSKFKINQNMTENQKKAQINLSKISILALQVLSKYCLNYFNYHNLIYELIYSNIDWKVEQIEIENKYYYSVVSGNKKTHHIDINEDKATEYMKKAETHKMLHADDSFELLVPELCITHGQKILFISNDNNLRERIRCTTIIKAGKYFNYISLKGKDEVVVDIKKHPIIINEKTMYVDKKIYMITANKMNEIASKIILS